MTTESKPKETIILDSPTTDTDLKSMEGRKILVGGFKTILENDKEYHIKHPLQSHWTLHQKIGSVQTSQASRAVSQSEWEDKLKESVTIGTVEDFWCLYNEMQAIDTIPTNCDYFFMREGVKPMWEDPANVGGGELRMTVVKAADGGAIWLNALLFAVGSQATSHEIINGIQFAFRPGRNRLSLWTAATTPANLDQLKLEFTSMIQGIVGEETNIRMEFNAFNKHGGGHGHGRGPSSQDHHQSSSGTTRPSSSSQHDGRARSDVKSSRSFSGSGGDSSKGGGGADGRGRFSGSFSRPGDTGNFGSRR